MEKNSALASKELAVAAEQVSMFLMDDNTLISFFEASAQDIEEPILRRLQTVDTILRRSCDASMLAQAVIDAIIDLAIPVSACYQEVIGDLELDVITSPTIEHTKRLYIMITEINKILSFISPITALITAVRDHKAETAQELTTEKLRDSATGVIITPLTYTYLGDVLDHSILITEELNQIKNQGSDMIDLIFNTISAYTNETMKQLTFTTILFLPLTFLTGYYGQNFEIFPDLKKSISYL
jgi:Mg2+ and Co2+ transporter CorA